MNAQRSISREFQTRGCGAQAFAFSSVLLALIPSVSRGWTQVPLAQAA